MEPRSGVRITVGLFVFAGLLLFAASIFFLGERERYFAAQHPLKAFFTNVAGLHEGATVRVAGVAVGRVTRIRLPNPPEQKVLVELSVAGDAIASVRRDSAARVDTMGFMGDKFVEISVGSPQEARLPDGATLRVEEALDFTTIVAEGRRVLERAERFTTALERGDGALPWLLNDPQSKQLVAETLRSVNTAANSLERGRGALPWLVNDPQSKRLVADTLGSVHAVGASLEHGNGAAAWLLHDPASRKVMQDVGRTAEALAALSTEVKEGHGLAHSLIYDPQGGEMLAKATKLMDDLGRTAETLAALSTQVKEGDGLAHALLYDPQGGEMLRKASRTVEEVQQLIDAIRHGDGAIPALLFDPESKQLVDNLTKASQHVEEISAKLARGDGTLGALLSDPTVYEDLTAVLEGAQRSRIVRWGFRHMLESGRAARKDTDSHGGQ